MKFSLVTKSDEWTMDGSLPLRVYDKDFEEFIFEICLNKKEIIQLRKELNLGLEKIKEIDQDRGTE